MITWWQAIGFCYNMYMKIKQALKASMNGMHRMFFASALTGVLMLVSCNSSSDYYEVDTVDMGSVAVKSFSLQANSNVMNNLDTVFFSIDLNNAQIYNADSLPYGTNVSAIAVDLVTDNCSAITIYSPAEEEGANDTEIDYLEDDDAKINFSKGPVKVNVVSFDGVNKRDYYIKINVHTVVPDSLYWSEAAFLRLPTSLQAPIVQKTVKAKDGSMYCYTYDGRLYNLGKTTDPFIGKWNVEEVKFPKNVELRTLTYAGNFYVLASDGELLSSEDAKTWNGTGEYWKSIVGAYSYSADDDKLLGLKEKNGVYVHSMYPASSSYKEVQADVEFPISGNSATIEFNTIWSVKPQVMTIGGRKMDGSLSGATWAFDGESWAKVGNGIPAAEGYSLFPYKISATDTVAWKVTETDVLMALGGRTAKGLNRNLYISYDMGMTWQLGSSLVQLPKYMPAVTDADVHVCTTTLKEAQEAKAQSEWNGTSVAAVPSCYAVSQSRAVSAIESWECPFIYLFGGIKDDWYLQTTVWRGVINHFSFRPLE